MGYSIEYPPFLLKLVCFRTWRILKYSRRLYSIRLSTPPVGDVRYDTPDGGVGGEPTPPTFLCTPNFTLFLHSKFDVPICWQNISCEKHEIILSVIILLMNLVAICFTNRVINLLITWFVSTVVLFSCQNIIDNEVIDIVLIDDSKEWCDGGLVVRSIGGLIDW